MALNDIVSMVNQISDFFVAYPHEVAVKEIAGHIRSFWDPRMRRQLFDHLEKTGGEGLKPVALEAARSLLQAA